MSDAIEVVTTPWYDAELAALPPDQQARILNRVGNLSRKNWGEAMADRSVAPLRDGIYEVRVLGRGAAFRLLFFVMPGRSPRLVVLTAVVEKSVMKKRQRLDAELQRAVERRARWLELEKARKADGGG